MPFQPPAPTATSAVISLWIAPSVPSGLREHIQAAADKLGGELVLSTTEQDAQVKLEANAESGLTSWIYALVSPFASIEENINPDRLTAIWQGSDPGKTEIFLAPETLLALEAVLGESGSCASLEFVGGELVDLQFAYDPAFR
jgi:hypothetical protein